MDISLQGLYEWFVQQGRYALFIVLIIVALVCAVKRAWILLIGAVVGLSAVGLFVLNPNIITSISEWFGGLLNMNS